MDGSRLDACQPFQHWRWTWDSQQEQRREPCCIILTNVIWCLASVWENAVKKEQTNIKRKEYQLWAFILTPIERWQWQSDFFSQFQDFYIRIVQTRMSCTSNKSGYWKFIGSFTPLDSVANSLCSTAVHLIALYLLFFPSFHLLTVFLIFGKWNQDRNDEWKRKTKWCHADMQKFQWIWLAEFNRVSRVP